jgi:hypothetical protein
MLHETGGAKLMRAELTDKQLRVLMRERSRKITKRQVKNRTLCLQYHQFIDQSTENDLPTLFITPTSDRLGIIRLVPTG